MHRRAVWLREDSYVLMYDEFVGTGRHEITVNYQFAPGTLAHLEGEGVVFDDIVDLVWVSGQAWKPTVARGGPGPGDGWIAPSLGIQRAAPKLTLTCTSDQPRTSLLTILATRTASKSRVALVAADTSPGVLAIVRSSDAVECIWADGIAPRYPIQSDALVAVCRVGDDGTLGVDRIGGSHLEIDAEAILELIRARSGWVPARP